MSHRIIVSIDGIRNILGFPHFMICMVLLWVEFVLKIKLIWEA
jgi:hypothetical protein